MTPNTEESLRILGVPDDASAETIRQTYLDLVRVWHPDRFQSDARLRLIAEDNLRKINDAYAALKDGSAAARDHRPPPPRTGETRTASGSSAGTSARETPPMTASPPFRKPVRQGHLSRGVAIVVCCAGPVWAILQAAMLLRVPALNAGPIFQPRILAPMRSIDPSLGVQGGGEALTAWAHGDLVDLWKPVTPATGPSSSAIQTAKPAANGRAHLTKSPAKPAEAEAAPVNGAELIDPARLYGQGDLRLANQTDLEAVVRLVAGSGATVRAIYIAPKESASFRSVAIGVYTVQVELGRNLDARHLRFLSERSTPAPIGPFQFLEITSDKGLSGSHFELALKPRS